MILNQEQMNSLNTRIGLTDTKYRWQNKTVPYSLAPDNTDEQVKQIKRAIDNLESVSCLKFVERTNENDFIQIYVSR